MNTKELFAALEMLEKEKGIPMDYMIENIEKGIEVACKNYYGGNDEVVFKILPDRNVFDVRLMKTVVEEVFDPDYEISLEDAQKVLKRKASNRRCEKYYSSGYPYRRKGSDAFRVQEQAWRTRYSYC